MRISVLFMILLGGLLVMLPVQAGVPGLIHYQGRLFNRVTGEPEHGAYRMAFRLFDGPDPEARELWFEVYDANPPISTEDVLVEQGFYQVQLGRLNPISSEVFSATDVYLEIQVGADSPMSPRQPILTAPFAFHAERLAGRPARDYLLVSDFVRHASDPNAHHRKTTRADEITSGVFEDTRIPDTVARLVDLEAFFAHIADTTSNPHEVDLTQAAGMTRHGDLLNTGEFTHDQLDAHIQGEGENRPVAPRNDHACPEEMVQVGDSCIDLDISEKEQTWFEAALACAEQGKRLCLSSEWYPACKESDALGLKNMGRQPEWIDHWSSIGEDDFLKPVYMGSDEGCDQVRIGAQITTRYRFRCCK